MITGERIAQKAFLCFAQCSLYGEGFVIALVAHLLCIEVGIRNQYQTNRDTGYEACQEQCRYGAVCCYSVDNHRDTGG